MEELDLLKKDWKKDNAFSQLGEKEIYGMLHRRSSSIVKWILLISIAELVVWTGIGLLCNNDDFQALLSHHPGVALFFNVMTWLNYAVPVVFIYLFYKNYVNISATASTRKLMSDILRTRRTVNYYVWYNLAMLVISFGAALITTFCYSPAVAPLREKAHEQKYMLLLIGIMLGVIVVFFAILWLIYRVIYGILLRRLLANYRELKKMDV